MTCAHEPDWPNATLEFAYGQLFVDVPCRTCHQSGCAAVFTTDSPVTWDDPPPEAPHVHPG